MAKDLKEKIMESVENLVTLEIMTAVGHVAGPSGGSDEGRSLPDLDYDRNPKMILTKIDLLQGDIKTVYHEDFVTGDYQELKAFHAAREKEGYNIIQQNIEALKSLLKMVDEHSEG